MSEPLGKRLDALSRQTGKSINTLVLELLKGALGVSGRRNQLKEFITWSDADVREFEQALKPQRQVDEALWR